MGNYWKIKIGKPNWGAKGQSSSSGRGLAIDTQSAKGRRPSEDDTDDSRRYNPERAVCRLSEPTADQPRDSRSNTSC